MMGQGGQEEEEKRKKENPPLLEVYMEHVELKGVEKEKLKAEIGEEKKEVEVDDGRLRGAGGGRGE